MKFVFYHRDFGIKAFFSKFAKNILNFCIFVFVSVVKKTLNWNSWEVHEGARTPLISVKVLLYRG